MFKDKIRMMLIYAKRKPIDRTRGMRAKGCQHFKGGLRLWAYLPIQYPILSMFSGYRVQFRVHFFLLDCELKTCVQHFFPPCLYGLLSLYFILRSMIPSMSTPILER